MKALCTADLHYREKHYDWIKSVAPGHDLVCIAGDLADTFLADADLIYGPGIKPASLKEQHHYIVFWLKAVSAKTTVALCGGNHDGWTEFYDAFWGLPETVIFDGKSRIVSSGSERILVTALPWEIKEREKVFTAAENIRAQEQITWVILNHIPPTPARFNPAQASGAWAWGSRSEMDFEGDWIAEKLWEDPPDILLSGHFHRSPYSRGWHDRVHKALCLNAGQWDPPESGELPQEIPNHIIIDTLVKTAAWHSFEHETGVPRPVETILISK